MHSTRQQAICGPRGSPACPLELALASAINLPDAPPAPAPASTYAASAKIRSSSAGGTNGTRLRTGSKKQKRQLRRKPALIPHPPETPQEPAQVAPEKTSAVEAPSVENDEKPAIPPAANLDLGTIKKNWRNIRSLVREHSRPTEALLNSCKLITVRKGVLILGFATPVLQSKMNTPENLELTRNAIAHLLGIEVPITTVVTKGNSGELPPDLDVDADGMVSAALDLGGKIVKQD